MSLKDVAEQEKRAVAEGIGGRLMEIYRLLRAHFGHQRWWPGETPFEVTIGAVLTQNTNWGNVERAIDNLKEAGALSPAGIINLTDGDLAELVRPSGYYNQKAKRLKALVGYLMERCGGDLNRLGDVATDVLRGELLDIRGIGPETADSILLYALGRPVFVVDAYTRRALARIGLAAENDGYDRVQRLFEENLHRDTGLFNDYHAQFVALGKHFCRRIETRLASKSGHPPGCVGCPLKAVCETGRGD